MAGEIHADIERVLYIPTERLGNKFQGNESANGKIQTFCTAITREAGNGIAIKWLVADNGTVRFTLRGTEETVQVGVGLLERRLTTEKRQNLRSLPEGVSALTVENLRKHNKKLVECRQFACAPCQNVWWRKVFAHKPVSRCARCRQRYDPIQRHSEYGWGRYKCQNCGHVFTGRAQAGVPAPCHQCGTMVLPGHIGRAPQNENGYRKTNKRHACARCNNGCIQPCPSFAQLQVTSVPHQSTGSTVSTFLTQASDESTYYEPLDT